MRTQLFCAVLVSAMAAIARAFPTGSPICNSNATAIQAAGKMGALQNNLGFTLDITSFPGGKYTPGKQYKLSVKGNQQFTGLLLYAVNADKTNHPGAFAIANGYKAVTPQNGPPCPGSPDGTITQTDGTPKGPNVDMMWTAPTGNAGPLSFLGVAVTGGKGFQLLKSDTISPNGGGTTTNTTTNAGGNNTTMTNGTMSGNGYGSGTGTGTGNGNGGTTDNTNGGNGTTNSAGTNSAGTSGAGALVANNVLLLTQFFIGAIGVYLFGLIAI